MEGEDDDLYTPCFFCVRNEDMCPGHLARHRVLEPKGVWNALLARQHAAFQEVVDCG